MTAYASGGAGEKLGASGLRLRKQPTSRSGTPKEIASKSTPSRTLSIARKASGLQVIEASSDESDSDLLKNSKDAGSTRQETSA